MPDSLSTYDTFIFDEMMVHPLFFTHPKLKKIAIIQPANNGILTEILKHPAIAEIWQIKTPADASQLDPRLQVFAGTEAEWFSVAPPASFDAIISPDSSVTATLAPAHYQQYANLLTAEGIFMRQADSLFDLERLKQVCQVMQSNGFSDLQILHFPQPSFPSGMRVAIMGMKQGPFRRIREHDIFNKLFVTRYYNFDTHKAGLVMPEFMREELILL